MKLSNNLIIFFAILSICSSLTYAIFGNSFGFIFFLLLFGFWFCTLLAKGIFKSFMFIQSIVYTTFFSISVFLTPISDDASRYALLGAISEGERYSVITTITILAFIYVLTITFLSQFSHYKLSQERVNLNFLALFNFVIFITIIRIIVNFTLEENLVGKIINFVGAYYRLDLSFVFLIVFGCMQQTKDRRTIWHSVVFFVLTTVGGSKEGLFRIGYAFIIRLRARLSKIGFGLYTSLVIILAMTSVPLIVFVATAVRLKIPLSIDNFLDFTSGTSKLIDGGLVNFILARLSGADDIIWTFDKGHIFETYYTFGNMVRSVIDYIVPLQVFDSLPLTNYINLSRGFSINEITMIYSSKEITLMGSAYHLSGSYLPGAMLYMMLLAILTFLVFHLYKGRDIYVVTLLYSSFYFIRSLSVDDTIGMTINYLLSAFIMVSSLKLYQRLKL